MVQKKGRSLSTLPLYGFLIGIVLIIAAVSRSTTFYVGAFGLILQLVSVIAYLGHVHSEARAQKVWYDALQRRLDDIENLPEQLRHSVANTQEAMRVITKLGGYVEMFNVSLDVILENATTCQAFIDRMKQEILDETSSEALLHEFSTEIGSERPVDRILRICKEADAKLTDISQS